MKQDSDLRNGLKSIKTRQAISDVESGQRAPSIALAIRLAKASLDCEVEYLFWLEHEE